MKWKEKVKHKLHSITSGYLLRFSGALLLSNKFPQTAIAVACDHFFLKIFKMEYLEVTKWMSIYDNAFRFFKQ